MPYVITPHGMLYPNALKRSYWKKWSLIQLFFNKDVRNATCLHATCRQEMENIRLFGYQGAIAVIPNPAVIPSYANSLFDKKTQSFSGGAVVRGSSASSDDCTPERRLRTFFMGVSLLDKKQEVELVIMGKGDERYERFLREEVKRLELTNVTFSGFVNGKAKI